MFDVPDTAVTPAHLENGVIVREHKNYIPDASRQSSPQVRVTTQVFHVPMKPDWLILDESTMKLPDAAKPARKVAGGHKK